MDINIKLTHIKLIVVCTLLVVFLIRAWNIMEDKQTAEGFDGKISNVTETQCGTECTISENCRGFGYKPTSSTCYLSKTAILGEPIESLYAKEYSKLDRRCNKINPIDDIDLVDDRTLTQNSVYVCSDGENNRSQEYQYANLGASSLQTGLTDGATRARGVPTHVANRPAVSLPVAVNYDLYRVEYPDPDNFRGPRPSERPPKEIEPNFAKLVRNSDDALKALQVIRSQTNSKDGQTGIVVTDDDVVLTGPVDDTARSAFIESDNEFLGQYLLAHQCVVNVPFYDCVKFCDGNERCAGVEYNRALIRKEGENTYAYENVCCPKQVIKKIIPRRNQFSRGKFYVKSDLNKIKGRDSVLLTRQNLQSPMGVADLRSTIQDNPRFSLRMTDRRSADVYHHDEQDMNGVFPVTNFVLPGDNDKANYYLRQKPGPSKPIPQ